MALGSFHNPETAVAVRDPRRFPRLRPEQLVCSLGPVLDVSRGGMRVLMPSPPVGRFDVVFGDGSRRVVIRVRPLRCRRLGPDRVEVALRFLDAPEHVAGLLTAICHDHRVRRAS